MTSLSGTAKPPRADALEKLGLERDIVAIVSAEDAGGHQADRRQSARRKLIDQLLRCVFSRVVGRREAFLLPLKLLRLILWLPDFDKGYDLVRAAGWLPFLLGRLARNHAITPGLGDPAEALRRIYTDTILHDPRVLRFVVDMIGADRIMMGSDMPFPIGDTQPKGIVEAAA
ncbi:MAG: amidohydrolase family protein [Akkermansiaceae bacterium]|nr:amidohydrolase family protein [Akkermansiaceae bacterium]